MVLQGPEGEEARREVWAPWPGARGGGGFSEVSTSNTHPARGPRPQARPALYTPQEAAPRSAAALTRFIQEKTEAQRGAVT